mmetsp:Transcript_19931/g.41805  ORF Transcript_19931/g.41805 Transcript_19931/m.41805 type:complete len:670 (+) Transcript_19931:211-2220(+)
MWSTGLFGGTNNLGFDRRSTNNNNQQHTQPQQRSTHQRGLPFQQQFQSPLSPQAPPHLQPLQLQLHQLQQLQRSSGVTGGDGATTSTPMAAAAAAAASIPKARSTSLLLSGPAAVSASRPPNAPAISSSFDPSKDVTADVFGQSGSVDSDVPGNINIAAAFAMMQTELLRIPENEKSALLMVQRLKPEMLDHEHMLKFLLVDNFNGVDAARRLVRYWNERQKLFGEKFCLPLTLKSALKDDSLALSRGYVQLLPETDASGRAILYLDWSAHEPKMGYSEESMHRVFWYMAHVAIEDPSMLKKGLVLLIYPQEARLDQFDQSLWTAISNSCKKSLPVRWRSTHIVHPNRFFSIIHPVFMSSLPKDVQDRVVVHSGTKMKVLANLLRYGLSWDRIPSDIGGCVDLDFENWLSDRMGKEDHMLDQKPSANVLGDMFQQQGQPSVSSLPIMDQGNGLTLPGFMENELNLNRLGNNAKGLLSRLIPRGVGSHPVSSQEISDAISGLAQFGSSAPQLSSAGFSRQYGNNTSASLLNLDQSKVPAQPKESSAPPVLSSGSVDDADSSVCGAVSSGGSSGDNEKKSKKPPAKGPKSMAKSGRKSDPRMDRAVQAKLNDPNLSLIDALRKGGFVFPAISDSGKPQYAIVDADNVKITQRKNQLLRRLRTTKKKSAEDT